MKKSRFFLALLFVSLLFVLLPATANGNASIWDVPVGPGESFRWVFATSGRRDATSDDISVYNSFVNGVAQDAPYTPIEDVVGITNIADIEWFAIASTQFVNAIDNIGPSMVPIYNPMGDLVAEGTSDMFDGSLVNHILYTEAGDTESGEVWTGSVEDGTVGAGTPLPLGNETVMTGLPDEDTGWWIYYGYSWNVYSKHFYAISEELTVVPVPGALMLVATGLLSLMGLKRLRHKHQE